MIPKSACTDVCCNLSEVVNVPAEANRVGMHAKIVSARVAFVMGKARAVRIVIVPVLRLKANAPAGLWEAM